MTRRCSPLRCEWVKEQCCHDRPDTAERQSKQGLYHRRDAEFAEFGKVLIKNSLLRVLRAFAVSSYE